MQTALQRSENREQDLQAFALKKSPKVLSEIIATKWKIRATPEIVARAIITLLGSMQPTVKENG